MRALPQSSTAPGGSSSLRSLVGAPDLGCLGTIGTGTGSATAKIFEILEILEIAENK